MAKHADGDKPVWITEFGYITGKKGWVTEKRQAVYLREAYSELVKGHFQALFWFSLGEVGGDNGDNFGLLREDGSKKPAYQIYHDRLPL